MNELIHAFAQSWQPNTLWEWLAAIPAIAITLNFIVTTAMFISTVTL